MLYDALDQFEEGVAGMQLVHVTDQLSYDLSVSIGLELVSFLHEELLDVLVVSDDTCDNDDKIRVSNDP